MNELKCGDVPLQEHGGALELSHNGRLLHNEARDPNVFVCVLEVFVTSGTLVKCAVVLLWKWVTTWGHCLAEMGSNGNCISVLLTFAYLERKYFVYDSTLQSRGCPLRLAYGTAVLLPALTELSIAIWLDQLLCAPTEQPEPSRIRATPLMVK